jgi:hypothetical protein
VAGEVNDGPLRLPVQPHPPAQRQGGVRQVSRRAPWPSGPLAWQHNSQVPSLATAPAFAGPMQLHHQQQPGRASQGEQGVGLGRRGDQGPRPGAIGLRAAVDLD